VLCLLVEDLFELDCVFEFEYLEVDGVEDESRIVHGGVAFGQPHVFLAVQHPGVGRVQFVVGAPGLDPGIPLEFVDDEGPHLVELLLLPVRDFGLLQFRLQLVLGLVLQIQVFDAHVPLRSERLFLVLGHFSDFQVVDFFLLLALEFT